MTHPTSFRRRRFVAIGLSVMLVAGLALGAKYAVDFLSGPPIPVAADGAAGGGGWTGGGVTDADGDLPDDGVPLTDVDRPAIANLDPALLAALQQAAAAAAADDIEFRVVSGWRSPELQARLLSEAVSVYGSEEEAARWVATPETSLHVSGDAVDLGDFDATYWLSLNGAAYGLCQVYANESWHFELRPGAAGQGCPEQYLDPTFDPRLQG